MRAALLVEFNEPFVVEDIDYLDPAPGRVLLRTGASPFCSTDCVNWRGELGKIPPTILGHASMGEVVEVGAGVTHIKVGQRAIVPGTSECGVCFYCSIGRPDQCSETFDRDGIWPHVADRRDGHPVSAAGNVGGYAEVMNVTRQPGLPGGERPPRRVARPARLRHHDRSWRGLQRRPGPGRVERRGRRPRPPRPVDGAGGEARRARARSSPSTRSPTGASSPARSARPTSSTPRPRIRSPQVQRLTAGRGADYVLEAATLASAQAQAILMSRRAGTVVLTSVERADATVTVPQVAIAVQSRAILSAQNGNVPHASRPAALHPR